MSQPPNKPFEAADIRFDAVTLAALTPCSEPNILGEQFRRDCEIAMRDPARDPIEEANAFRDTPPEDVADELQLAKGEIAWLREAMRRLMAMGG